MSSQRFSDVMRPSLNKTFSDSYSPTPQKDEIGGGSLKSVQSMDKPSFASLGGSPGGRGAPGNSQPGGGQGGSLQGLSKFMANLLKRYEVPGRI
jgi:hypothetical protein